MQKDDETKNASWSTGTIRAKKTDRENEKHTFTDLELTLRVKGESSEYLIQIPIAKVGSLLFEHVVIPCNVMTREIKNSGVGKSREIKTIPVTLSRENIEDFLEDYEAKQPDYYSVLSELVGDAELEGGWAFERNDVRDFHDNIRSDGEIPDFKDWEFSLYRFVEKE